MQNISVTVNVVKRRPSKIFVILVLRSFFLYILTQLLILMKTPPMTPPRRPRMNAPTRQSRPGAFCEFPSFTISEEETVIGRLLSQSYLKAEREKVAIVEAKNTFQVKENDQKVLGFEIS
jgi:hypothetical protein